VSDTKSATGTLTPLKNLKLISSAQTSAIKELAADFIHEVNNPLSVILTNAEIINHEKIIASTQRITRLIKAMRTNIREESLAKIETIHPRDVLDQVLLLLGTRLRNHGIEIKTTNFPESLSCDARFVQIFHALMHLLSNAHDAINQPGTEEKWIDISANESGEYIEIAVTDSGKGIPPKLVKKIFEPFFTTKGAKKGLGLGLTKVSEIAKNHGGLITLDTNSDHTRFVMKILKHHPEAHVDQPPAAASGGRGRR
jgi:C4-dicarboxylate-specific signal transduction histidine kinase